MPQRRAKRGPATSTLFDGPVGEAPPANAGPEPEGQDLELVLADVLASHKRHWFELRADAAHSTASHLTGRELVSARLAVLNEHNQELRVWLLSPAQLAALAQRLLAGGAVLRF